MQQHYAEFRQFDTEVLVVSQARPELLAAFLREQTPPFSLVADPERIAYRTFGLELTTWVRMLHPGVVLRYLRLIFRGWHLQQVREGEDVQQLGGDFLLDAEGRLIYAYRSAEPTDRPTIEALLQVVRQAAPAGSRPGSAGHQP